MPWAHLSSSSFKFNAQPFNIFIFQLVSVFKREWVHTLTHWIYFLKIFHDVAYQLPILAAILILFPLLSNWFHILNDKSFNLLFDAKKVSCVAAIFWLLNLLLCMVAPVKRRKVRLSDLGHKPKGHPGCRTSPVMYKEPNKDKIPNPPTSISLCRWNPIASCLNSICWTKWRDQGE